MASIELDGITKSFGDTTALQSVDLTLEAGGFFSLLGPSGCGKSTLLKIIAGLERPTSGRVRIGGHDVADLRPSERNIAMVFQSYALYPHLTVGQNIALPLAMRRLNRLERLPLMSRLLPTARGKADAIQKDVEAVARTLEITRLLERRPAQLSGGQKQRVAVGRALVRRPSVFLLDEPLSNLDAQLRVQMREELIEVHRRFGITFVYVTHDQAEAMAMSDRIAVVMEGRIAQCDAPQNLYERPATLEVARFVGASSLNVLACDSTADGQLGAPFRDLAAPRDCTAEGRLIVGFRPEDAWLSRDGSGHVQVRTQRVEYHGGLRHLIATAAGVTLRAVIPQETASPASGDAVWLRLTPDLALLFDPRSERRLDAVPKDIGITPQTAWRAGGNA
ncbi:ABC transporter ATP-binding protein [Algihabitans sp.]|uniref:ABC transporter ATP-binding protein n=1 Tax=Algihabitans sp. TaxID=2821514 RepID=UPI003BABA5C5